ncbi:hypothetical protein AAMO2058_001557300 [Amorphochlora amoebiformis]
MESGARFTRLEDEDHQESKTAGTQGEQVLDIPREARISIPNGIETCNFLEVSNVVITSKYTLFNFIFLNLWDQFQEVSNIYFFFIGILQIIPEITTTAGIPDVYIPLSFILFVSGVRAAVDDYSKHKEDRKVASRQFEVFDPGYAEAHERKTQYRSSMAGLVDASDGFFFKRSGDIRIGDVLRIKAGETFPADMILLNSAYKSGHCFVETASLDGETNLKLKEAPPELLAYLGNSTDRLMEIEDQLILQPHL